jgi:hypothetical protein
MGYTNFPFMMADTNLAFEMGYTNYPFVMVDTSFPLVMDDKN